MHKYFLIFLVFFFFGLHLSAQVEYGTITYIRTAQVNVDAGQGEMVNKELKEMMAKMAASGAFTNTYLATFTPDGFNFVEQEKEQSRNQMETTGGMVIVVETGPVNLTHYHTDLKAGTVTNTDYIFDKQFLVSGETEKIDWTLTNEKVAPSEATAGLDLLIATGISATGDTLTAGYAPSLPVQVGPNNYYGLPGAIITLDVKNGKRNYRYQATSLSLSSDPLPLEAPSEGKEITMEKYLKEQKKREGSVKRMMIRGVQ